MRKIVACLLVLVLSAGLAVAVSGCGQQQKAQEMVQSANPDVQKGNQGVERLRQIWTQIQALPENVAGFKKGVVLSKQGAAAATTAKGEYQKALDAIERAKKLDVAADYRKYMGLKEVALQARVQGLQLSADRFAQIEKLYQAAIARNIKAWKAAKTRITAISAKIAKLPDSDKLDTAANTFGKQKGFGG